jgi:hypothetical protein
VPRTRRVENLRHGALTTTAGTREGSTITVTAPNWDAATAPVSLGACAARALEADPPLPV